MYEILNLSCGVSCRIHLDEGCPNLINIQRRTYVHSATPISIFTQKIHVDDCDS